jgi:hypothetical protein
MLSYFFEQMIHFLENVARFLFSLIDLLKSVRENGIDNSGLLIFVCILLIIKRKKKRVYES